MIKVRLHDEQSNLSKMKWDYAKDEEQALRWIIKPARVLTHLRCIAKTWDINDGNQGHGSNYGYTHSQADSSNIRQNVNCCTDENGMLGIMDTSLTFLSGTWGTSGTFDFGSNGINSGYIKIIYSCLL